MDKEDCIQILLSTLQKPQWKSGNSVTDWDLKNVLWRSGLLLGPDQTSALLADVKRRGLIVARERREDGRLVTLWGVQITPAGEEWLSQRRGVQFNSVMAAQPEAKPETVTATTGGEGETEEAEPPEMSMEASLT